MANSRTKILIPMLALCFLAVQVYGQAVLSLGSNPTRVRSEGPTEVATLVILSTVATSNLPASVIAVVTGIPVVSALTTPATSSPRTTFNNAVTLATTPTTATNGVHRAPAVATSVTGVITIPDTAQSKGVTPVLTVGNATPAWTGEFAVISPPTPDGLGVDSEESATRTITAAATPVRTSGTVVALTTNALSKASPSAPAVALK